jgi:hypothetical protein
MAEHNTTHNLKLLGAYSTLTGNGRLNKTLPPPYGDRIGRNMLSD